LSAARIVHRSERLPALVAVARVDELDGVDAAVRLQRDLAEKVLCAAGVKHPRAAPLPLFRREVRIDGHEPEDATVVVEALLHGRARNCLLDLARRLERGRAARRERNYRTGEEQHRRGEMNSVHKNSFAIKTHPIKGALL